MSMHAIFGDSMRGLVAKWRGKRDTETGRLANDLIDMFSGKGPIHADGPIRFVRKGGLVMLVLETDRTWTECPIRYIPTAPECLCDLGQCTCDCSGDGSSSSGSSSSSSSSESSSESSSSESSSESSSSSGSESSSSGSESSSSGSESSSSGSESSSSGSESSSSSSESSSSESSSSSGGSGSSSGSSSSSSSGSSSGPDDEEDFAACCDDIAPRHFTASGDLMDLDPPVDCGEENVGAGGTEEQLDFTRDTLCGGEVVPNGQGYWRSTFPEAATAASEDFAFFCDRSVPGGEINDPTRFRAFRVNTATGCIVEEGVLVGDPDCEPFEAVFDFAIGICTGDPLTQKFCRVTITRT